MEKTKHLPAPNNKALFHTLTSLLADVMNDEESATEEKVNKVCNLVGKVQKTLEIEIDRAKTSYLIGQGSAAIREIETKLFEETNN